MAYRKSFLRPQAVLRNAKGIPHTFYLPDTRIARLPKCSSIDIVGHSHSCLSASLFPQYVSTYNQDLGPFSS